MPAGHILVCRPPSAWRSEETEADVSADPHPEAHPPQEAPGRPPNAGTGSAPQPYPP